MTMQLSRWGVTLSNIFLLDEVLEMRILIDLTNSFMIYGGRLEFK